MATTLIIKNMDPDLHKAYKHLCVDLDVGMSDHLKSYITKVTGWVEKDKPEVD